MALIKADRVKETSTSTGATTFALSGAYTGFRTFSSVCSVGDTFYYVIDSDLGSEWETGLGTYSAANTLTRTTVHASSNGGSIVTFSAGTKNVYISLTGNQLGTLATLTGSEVLTNKTINASNNTITNVSLTTGVTGTLPLANGGTGTTTAQLAINALAGAVTSGSYLRGNGTNVVMAAIQAADVPTLNQNTTGTASGSVSGTASYLAKFTGTNVVGNSQIYDNGTNVGIGTASPTGYKFVVRTTGTSAISVVSAGSNTPGPTMDWYDSTNTTEAVLACASGQVNFGAYSNHPLVLLQNAMERMRLHTGGTVGINETIPGAQLQVTTNAAATKGLIVKGASAQSANLQEWQNSSGALLASIASNGYFNVNRDSVYTDYLGQIALQGATDGNKRLVIGIDTTNNIGFMQSYLNSGGTSYPIILQPNNNGTATVGIGGVTSPDAQLHVTSHLAARKGLIVRGASGQTASLTEWQNSLGTTYASVNNNFGASFHGWSSDGPHGGIEQVCLSAGNKGFWSANDAALMTIGFVGIAGVYDGTSWSMYFKTGTAGATTEKMRLTGSGLLGIGTSSPTHGIVIARNGSTPAINIYKSPDGVLRSAQQVVSLGTGSSANNSGTTGGNEHGILQLFISGVARCQLYAYAGGGGFNNYVLDGMSFGQTSAAAGQVVVAPVSAATKGLIVKGFTSQSANLQEWQSSAGTALATVNASGSLATSGSITSSSGLKTSYTNEYDFLRAAPTTVGDYVEICSYFSFSNSLEVTAVSQQGAGIGTTIKKYIINSVYGMWNFILAPIDMNRQGGYESTFDFELEVGPPDGGFNVPLRLRRTAGTSARNVLITVKNISVYGHDLTPLSGTGTSAISLTNISGVYINPFNYALPVSGTSGNGRDIGFYAGSAIGTGAGGNILLQAGAFATSGSNGKVIVRGLASNTANLQEWQNNAGSVLSAVKSDGSIQPASMADSAATNNSIYYSTTASKLVYKDAAGTVNNLY